MLPNTLHEQFPVEVMSAFPLFGESSVHTNLGEEAGLSSAASAVPSRPRTATARRFEKGAILFHGATTLSLRTIEISSFNLIFIPQTLVT